MSNEANVGCYLSLRKNNTQYQSAIQAFQADVNGQSGPIPGAVIAAIGAGTVISFTGLTQPGLGQIINLEPSGGNFVTVGTWDGSTFFPLFELLPGECYNFRMSRHYGTEYGSGTGTVTGTYSLKLVADTAAVNVAVLFFEA